MYSNKLDQRITPFEQEEINQNRTFCQELFADFKNGENQRDF
jgi:hypothetical protein